MELVDGGTLSSEAGKLSWPEFRRVILDVLDALGHAHARGLIHRDIKPANVLMNKQTRRIKLTDFGLVHHTRQQQTNTTIEDEFVSGTPSYMAPEQIMNDRTALGPWTDLYAVGITAWALACGRLPFRGTVDQVLQQHLRGDRPPFESLLPMPIELVDWLDAMLATNPQHRFQCAADAAWVLTQIEPDSLINLSSVAPSRAVTASDDSGPLNEMSTRVLNVMTTAVDPLEDATAILPDELAPLLSSEFALNAQSPLTRMRPPLPEDWQIQRHTRTHLHGAGLALFSLRTAGVIGRESERNHLWRALKRVNASQKVECVLIEGTSGSGTSTLAQWLSTRAHEVGGVQYRSVNHSTMRGDADGMSALLSWSLPIQGLERADAIAQTHQHLSAKGMNDLDDAIGLVQLARPHERVDEGQGLSADFSNQTERIALLSRYFIALAKHRALILWLDNLHLASEGMALAEHLLKIDVDVPLMLLGTVATEEVHGGTELSNRFDELVSRPNTSRIQLKPLDTDGQVALIRELLGLDLALAATVEQRCGGNPQFAVQLVSDWVERGLLVPSEEGFTLRPGADTAIPNDMIAMWRQRLARAFAAYSSVETSAIELGAMLGTEVSREEWEDAMQVAGISPSVELMSELQRQRLIIPNAETKGWSFVHALFHAAVMEHAQHGGRTERWANVAAEILPPGDRSIARKAHLLVAANRAEDALGPLSEAILHEASNSEYGRSRQLFELRESILSKLPVDDDGQHALATAVCRYFQQQHNERYSVIQDIGPELIAWAERHEEWDFICRLKLDLGTSFMNQGQSEKGTPYIQSSLDLARKHRLPIVHAILNRMCYIAGATGKLGESVNYAREAIYIAELRGDVTGVGHAYMNLSRICRERGDAVAAEYHCQEARLRFERTGSRMGLADCYMTQGEQARARGDHAAAERAYLESAARYRGCGDANRLYAELNLAMTYLEMEKFTEAKQMLVEVRKQATPQASKLLLWIRLCNTCCIANEANWDLLETEIREVQAGLETIGIYDLDAAGAATICANLCEAQGRIDLAKPAWEIVINQLRNMDRNEEALAIENKIRG
jgi:tetratricopeptide (TPR) repeat protein